MEKPLVFHAISVFMGSLAALLLGENAILGAVFSACFFCVFYFTLKKSACMLTVLFFTLGMLSFNIYFGAEPSQNAELRLTDKRYYDFIGDYKGRKVLVKGETKGLALGEKITAEGSFEREWDCKKGIIGSYYIESYEKYKPDIITAFYRIKRDIYSRFNEKLGEENSSVLMALCFGDTAYLTKSQMNEFNRMGVIHAISVSGFHMALVYGVLDKLFGARMALAIAFIYAVFTGCQAATLRAFLMIFILKMSGFAFKNYDSISSLSMAALLLIVIKPWFIGDIGFMLSFLSTLGIILYFRKFTLLFWRLPGMLRDTVSICLSAQLLSLPYIAFSLQQFSPGFILGNLILMPFYTVLVILGNAALLLSPIAPIFNMLCGITGFIMDALSGANYILLRLCPEVTHFSYLHGVSLMLIYLSFIFYKKGYRQVLYYPVFVILFLCICNFSLFPEIYYKKLRSGSCTFIEYRDQCIMVCSHDHTGASEIYRLKEDVGVTKVISNVRSRTAVHMGGNISLIIYPVSSIEQFNNIEIHIGSKIYRIDGKSVGGQSDIYVIIFYRLMHFS
ncbi:MAG: ComEC/Rec2 family competence protein [Clostridiaceae bacterium]